MIEGIYFKMLPSKNPLYQILQYIDIKKYNWYNVDEQNEVWDSNMNNVFFEKKVYDGNHFFNKICLNHFIVFLKLQAYLTDGTFFDIHTYEEFQQSDCQIILLIYDCECVEIYSKDQSILKLVYNHAILNNYTDVKFISEQNRFRTKMDIL